MPKIPTYQPRVETAQRGISPEAAAAPSFALARAGEQIGRTADYALRTAEYIQHKEQQASQAVEALKIENGLKEDFSNFAETYAGRIDYENFNSDAREQLDAIQSKYRDMIGGDQELSLAFQRVFENQSTSFMRMVNDKKRQVITDQGKAEYVRSFDQALKDYSAEPDPEGRDMIRKGLEMKAWSLASRRVISQAQAEKYIQDFDNKADDVRADQMIDSAQSPQQAQDVLDLLHGGSFDRLSPDIRQNKIERAEAKMRWVTTQEKIRADEEAKKAKEAQKKAHDDEERSIGNAFMRGDYADAYQIAYKSNFLSGDEKKTWASSIKEAAKTKEEKIDPGVQAAEIVKVNAMISTGEDPDKIRLYIIQTPNLTKGDKEQYLNKLEANLSTEIKDARGKGYKDIQDVIIPKRGMLSKLLESPLETIAVKKAQMALDDWIDFQVKRDVYPTAKQIRQKAFQFANEYQVSIAERIQQKEDEARQTASQMKEYAEAKVQYQGIPKEEREKIEDTLREGGYLVTVLNVVNAYNKRYDKLIKY